MKLNYSICHQLKTIIVSQNSDQKRYHFSGPVRVCG